MPQMSPMNWVLLLLLFFFLYLILMIYIYYFIIKFNKMNLNNNLNNFMIKWY